MQKFLAVVVLALAVVIVSGLAPAVAAQPVAPQAVFGVVTAVDAEAGLVEITTAQGVVVTLTVQPATVIYHNGAVAPDLSDYAVGDATKAVYSDSTTYAISAFALGG